MFDNCMIRKEHCIPQETEINDVRLANAYVPFQRLCPTFDPLMSLLHGTAFPPLVSEYDGRDRRFVLNED